MGPHLFIKFLLLDAVLLGGVMGRSCAASSQFKAKPGPKNPPRWGFSFPSEADSTTELTLGLFCVGPDLCGVV